VRAFGVAAVYVYRYTFGVVLAALAPAPGGRCKYHPSCSEYAIQAFRRYGLLRGGVLAGWRLLRCNPWSHGGVDRAEDQRLFRQAA
jgi:putative membrane protein insertion efficiency factor